MRWRQAGELEFSHGRGRTPTAGAPTVVGARIDDVTEVLREAAEVAILPRYRLLAGGEVAEKSPGEWVTIADRESEKLISQRLLGILDVPVVGEEAATEHPELLAAVHSSPMAWLVDPLDGTSNSIAGLPDFAVMAALRPLVDACGSAETVALYKQGLDAVWVSIGDGATPDASADPGPGAEQRGRLAAELESGPESEAESSAERGYYTLGPITILTAVLRYLDGKETVDAGQRACAQALNMLADVD
jgi:Inositol monophosphatase family